jgi:hypothetical protein
MDHAAPPPAASGRPQKRRSQIRELSAPLLKTPRQTAHNDLA